MLQIAYVEDSAGDVEIVRHLLAAAHLHAAVRQVACTAEALHDALQRPCDIVLSDHRPVDFSAELVLDLTHAHGDAPPVVVVTQRFEPDEAVRLFRAGARDCLEKGCLSLLPATIVRVIAQRSPERKHRRLVRELALANERYRVLSARMLNTQEREREAIARDLHDGLGQLLTSMVIRLHAADRTRDQTMAHGLRQQVLAMADQAVDEVRTLSFDLRPAQLSLLGFVSAVRAMLERKFGSAAITADLRVIGTESIVPPPDRAITLRILQQILINVLRHAHAQRVAVRIRFLQGGRVRLLVADDGRGFDARAMLARPVDEQNQGLHDLTERAELAGGRLVIRSRPGSGTLVCLCL